MSSNSSTAPPIASPLPPPRPPSASSPTPTSSPIAKDTVSSTDLSTAAPPQSAKTPPLLPPSPPSSAKTPAPLSRSSKPLSPLTTGGESKSSQASPQRGSSSRAAEVIAAAIGAAILLVLLIAACFCCSRRRKKKPHNPLQYYADNSVYKGAGNSTYYTSGPQPQWQSQVGAAASVSSFGPPGGGWHIPPPPPDMNSAAYSEAQLGPPMPPPSPNVVLGFNKGTFTYEELTVATNNFSQANLLGQGGFGYVHKGVLPNGREVAVKQLKSGSEQGEREFQAEVDIISRVHHRHLVSLVGYCIAGTQRMLVYEFVPNKTLEFHLHGKGLPVMDWSRRLRIALGSAKGLAYLHEDCHPRIIHRDIKSANILLDNNFEAMVADFGLAKLTTDNNTHVSTRVMGTFGYLAPEYASSGKLTEKSDVFSYDVMLLELLTGRRPVDASHTFMEDSLVDWARPVLSRALADGNYDDLADPRMDGNYDQIEMARVVASAAACVRHCAKKRSKMSQIVRALEGDVSLEDLNEGVLPGQSMLFSSGSEYNPGSYTSNMNRIRRVALVSPEYSGEMSELGHPSPISSDDAIDDDMSPVTPVGKQRHLAC